MHRPRPAVRVGLALLTFLLSFRAVAAEAESVVSLLEALREQGVNVIYSSDLVPSDLHAPALPDNLPFLHHEPGLLRINGLYRHGWLLAPALVERLLDTAGLAAPFLEHSP